jgi:uncharacterized DUF497 family protein
MAPVYRLALWVLFQWDEAKNRRNKRKHKISFELAREAFLDPFCLTVPDENSSQEERFWTIGRLANSGIIVVVHTFKEHEGEELIRIISARKATPGERKLYEEVD